VTLPAGRGAAVLVDTSVWVEVFRKPSRVNLEAIVPLGEVVTCLPVIQEVLQGFRDERAWRVARGAMMALPRLESPIAPEVFEHAVDLYRAARRKGLTVRSGVDCLIAACALRAGLPVLHRDRDFRALAGICALTVRELPRD
jgi:hypothetical protein